MEMEEGPDPELESILAHVREEMEMEERIERGEVTSGSLTSSSHSKDKGQPPEEVMDMSV